MVEVVLEQELDGAFARLAAFTHKHTDNAGRRRQAK
jgi:hypothetical protein